MQAQVKKSPKDANKMFSENVPNDDATSFFLNTCLFIICMFAHAIAHM